MRHLFTELENCWFSYPTELRLAVYQWIEEPRHILVFGERAFSHEYVTITPLFYISFDQLSSNIEQTTLKMFGVVILDRNK